MSKAFTREDDAGDGPPRPRPVSPLPPGRRNNLTPGGARRLQEELTRLTETERPALLAAAGESGLRGADAKEELQRAEQRILYLQEALRTAEIVPPPPPPHDVVRFGATVTVRDAAGAETTYRIVGVDEADPARGEVSWLSPLARALLNARLGQRVPFRFPNGTAELEVVRLAYETEGR
jgi:transcription elongation factor GreB